MTIKAIFNGLVFDEEDKPVDCVTVGDEPFYVVDDHGFRRHIPAEQVDRQVFENMTHYIEGNEEQISAQTAKMLGQDDIFSKALIANQLKNIDSQFTNLQQVGIPEESRAYLGMIGFRVVINLHGEVVQVNQPGISEEGDGG